MLTDKNIVYILILKYIIFFLMVTVIQMCLHSILQNDLSYSLFFIPSTWNELLTHYYLRQMYIDSTLKEHALFFLCTPGSSLVIVLILIEKS